MEKDLFKKMTVYTPLYKMVNIENNNNLIKLEENIWVLKNFVTEEIRNKYLNYASNLSENDWWVKNRDWWVGKYVQVEQNNSIDSSAMILRDKLKEIILGDLSLGPFGSIHRLTEGFGMFIHTDNPTEQRDIRDEHKNVVASSGGHNNYAMVAFICYLNDNYEGGEIYFPEIGLEYKATAGDLLIFPAIGQRYDHGVRIVKPGPTRYVTTAFGYDKRVEKLKTAGYVFENSKKEFVKIDPNKVINDPEEVQKMPKRFVN